MNEQETFEQAQRYLAKLKADYNERLKARSDELAETNKFISSIGSNPRSLADKGRLIFTLARREEIEKAFDQLKATYDRTIDYNTLKVTQLEAQFLLKKQADEDKLAVRQAAEEKVFKDNALRAYVLAGGYPSEFEAVYPTIRQAFLNQQTTNALRTQTTKPLTIHL